MQVSVLVHSETVLESALCHLEDSILYSVEFALDRWVVLRKIRKSAKHLQRFLLAALEDQPLCTLSA
jgi:hypothetical protein